MANITARNLLFLIQKRFLKTSATLSLNSSSFTVQFLVNSCGFPLESAISASKKIQLHKRNLKSYQSVLEFLKAHDFNNNHIAKLIGKRPRLLQCKVERNLKPKFEFLIKNGFMGKNLHELFLSNPTILERSLDSHIKPSLEYLKSVFGCDAKVLIAAKRSSWLLTCDLKRSMQPNIDFLIKEGVPVCCITKIVALYPRPFIHKPHRMVYGVNSVKNLGFEPKAPMFMHALAIMLSMNESTWKKKIEMMKNVGWSEGEILSTFKRYPYFVTCSEEKFKCMMDFYMNTMNLGLNTITAYPLLLKSSIDKRIRPRYNVLKVLESMKLIKWGKNIGRLLTIDERSFLKNYITKYEDKVPGLLDIYHGTSKDKKMDA